MKKKCPSKCTSPPDECSSCDTRPKHCIILLGDLTIAKYGSLTCCLLKCLFVYLFIYLFIYLLFQLIAMILESLFMALGLSQTKMVDFPWELWFHFLAMPTTQWLELKRLRAFSRKMSICGMEKCQFVIHKVCDIHFN